MLSKGFRKSRDPRETSFYFLQGMCAGIGLVMLLFAFVIPAQASHEDTAAWRLIKERCTLCHYLDRAEAKFAPSLKGLFQRQTLMNGKPVNDQTVSEWISEGSANMPAFKHTLNPQQIQTISITSKITRRSTLGGNNRQTGRHPDAN
jgi:mono/diheme cytochrome c family protein